MLTGFFKQNVEILLTRFFKQYVEILLTGFLNKMLKYCLKYQKQCVLLIQPTTNNDIYSALIHTHTAST